MNLSAFTMVSTLSNGLVGQTFQPILFKHDGKLHQTKTNDTALHLTAILLRFKEAGELSRKNRFCHPKNYFK